MVTIIKKLTGGAYPFYEYACLSTDTKPVSLVPENSICHEIDTGKHFYFGNGEWKELPPKGGSGGGSGGGGLPADFPAEGIANANKFLGFDASGDYVALDAPSGGGAEKFVVTLTQDAQTEEWTADKTIAEIVAADAANKVVVAKYPLDGVLIDVPFLSAVTFTHDGEEMSSVVFGAIVETDNLASIIIRALSSTEDEWDIEATNIEIPGAPLVVTMTEDDGTWTADKTIAEILEANGDGEIIVGTAEENGLTWEIPCISTVNTEEAKGAIFAGIFTTGDYVNTLVFVGLTQDGSDVWQHYNIPNNPLPSHSSSNNGQVLGVSSGNLAWVDNYAPLIVTLTADQQNPGTYVGDKTFGEIHAAATAGRTVVFVGNAEGSEFVWYCTSMYIFVEDSNTVYQAYYDNGGDTAHFEGGELDYPTVTGN